MKKDNQLEVIGLYSIFLGIFSSFSVLMYIFSKILEAPITIQNVILSFAGMFAMGFIGYLIYLINETNRSTSDK
jgi:hypothetical protein